jgi:DNA-binding CsgD family transcriptional regulator
MTEFTCPDDHKHAVTTTCYNQHKCRCTKCRAGVNAKARTRKKAQAYGRYASRYVPAGPARARIKQLQAAGLGVKQIARAAGISRTTAAQLVWGRDGREVINTLATTAERVLAVTIDPAQLTPGAAVSSIPTRRRLQALVAVGHSLRKIAVHLECKPQNLEHFMKNTYVMARTHLAIAALYEELWNVAPSVETKNDRLSVTMAKRAARERGWLPPMAWDDIDTDVAPPTMSAKAARALARENLDEINIELAMTGANVFLTPDEREEAVARLNAAGLNDHAIADRLHVDARTALRIRHERLGLPANAVNQFVFAA